VFIEPLPSNGYTRHIIMRIYCIYSHLYSSLSNLVIDIQLDNACKQELHVLLECTA
jgi:hypothetical protein